MINNQTTKFVITATTLVMAIAIALLATIGDATTNQIAEAARKDSSSSKSMYKQTYCYPIYEYDPELGYSVPTGDEQCTTTKSSYSSKTK